MILDLSSVEVFESDEIDFDKKITFIFGKNGTGILFVELLKRLLNLSSNEILNSVRNCKNGLN